MPIENVSDTARWVAVYRAMETERPDAIFRDPHARRLAGERGEQIVRELHRGRGMAWAMIVRTAVFNEIILDTIARREIDTVLNLAAGLDTRAWRLSLPPSLRWVDVDLPAMLEYKRAAMRDVRPACRYEAMAADLTDAEQRRSTLARIGEGAKQMLVVTEGLLIYLTAEQVSALASDLHAVPAAMCWLLDLASPQLLQWISQSWGHNVAAGNAPFRFGPAEGTNFFLPLGWREAQYRSVSEEARRLHREMRMMWLWRFLGRLASAERREEMRRFSGIVLLDRVP